MRLDFFWNKRIHMDFASTTPVHRTVLSAMHPYFSKTWANPSAIYKEGVLARKAVESARAELARTLHVRQSDIVFTSGGTESNNLALIGFVCALHRAGKPYSDMEIISTRIEHPSILETLAYLSGLGVRVVFVNVDAEGRIDLENLNSLFTDKTIVCTFAYVNSEVGTIQDVKKITRLVRTWNESHKGNIRTHLDACQAPLWLPCTLDQLGVDLMSLDAGKCYGPKGAGVLVKRHWIDIEPIMYGGSQEHELRPGTENTPNIVGCVKSLVRAQETWSDRAERVSKLRDRLTELLTEIPGVVLNGSRTRRVANNVNISIPGIDTEFAVISLDAKNIAASTRSACGGGGHGSSVVREITGDETKALATLRFTLGEETEARDLARVKEALVEHLALVRNLTS